VIQGKSSGQYSALRMQNPHCFWDGERRQGSRNRSCYWGNWDLLQVSELGAFYAAGVTGDDARTTGDREEDKDELLGTTWGKQIRWDRQVWVVAVGRCGKRKCEL